MKTTNTYFKTAAHTKSLSAIDMAALALYKAAKCKSDDKVGVARALLKRAFSPVTKPAKLNAGAAPYGELNSAVYLVSYRIRTRKDDVVFCGMTQEEKEQVLALANTVGGF